MASTLTSTLRAAFLQIPRRNFQSVYQLHQIASQLTAIPTRPFKEVAPGSAVIPSGALSPLTLIGCGWFTQSVRHKIRNYFPKPRENKRQQWTWWSRMKTKGGRMILMRKLIKGKWVLADPL